MTADDLAPRIERLTIRDRQRLGRRFRGADGRKGREQEALEQEVVRAEARRAARAAAVPQLTYPEELPVTARREDIMAAIRDHQVVVVAGETGSGKTTQLPKMCLELGRGVDGMIGHTQPRRIAARTVAERLAEETGVVLGTAVGYSVRFTDTVGDTTLVKVMTDGILLAEIRRDRLLNAYDTIIVDEAHERSLNIDFLLGYLAQLLPRRPDLRVVITSATIDTARFAAHFDAPVIEVSGRSYPVDIRYLTPEDHDDEDPGRLLCDAVAEAMRDNPGDVLVFLPGERDIRDAADALRHSGPDGIEVLPLYARLSAAEQHRVFKPYRGRRVVLATNVAETSLTVPGIRSVVDTGLARVSRFSHRTKVQRLRIEPVSRASADQRAGRCGRVAPGVCIRLYPEEDYLARPEYTDPEILRTNLASVILQMEAIGLGEIEAFPFIEPPDKRSVADGRLLLEELGALEPTGGKWRITDLGRRLARLPLDPRLGRMVLEGARRGCLSEVTIIAAALSVQDPRERPTDQAAEADGLHARFAVPGSDFLGFVALWNHLAATQKELSGNQFRKRCRAEFLNVLRIREWQDVAGQIRQTYRSEGIHANTEPAAPDAVHQALLTGLLSHVGRKDRARGDYEGARGTRWQVGRASGQSRRQPAWAMAGELVETERTWARHVAAIEPVWAERAGAHVVQRRYSEPWWEPSRGEASVDERVTLYGLLVAERRAALARVDPVAARAMFVQKALVDGDWDEEPAALTRARDRIRAVEALEERLRRRDLLAGEAALRSYYDSVVPADVSGGRRFVKWLHRAGPDVLEIPYAVLLAPGIGPVDLSLYPDELVDRGVRLPLTYRYRPGAAEDGVTADVPLAALDGLDPGRLEWHVPGYRPELVAALVRLLPKPVRRALGPAPEVAAAVVAGAGPETGPMRAVVAERLSSLSGEPVDPEAWDLEALAPHLRLQFAVRHPDGRVLARGRDLADLRADVAEEIRGAIARLAPELVRTGQTSWSFGSIPRRIDRDGFTGYPALVDEGDTVGVGVTENPRAQAATAWLGARRLLLLTAPPPVRHIQRRLGNDTRLAVARSGSSLEELIADCAAAAVDDMLLAAGGPPYEPEGFGRLAASARQDLGDRVARLAIIAGGVMAAADSVRAAASRLSRKDIFAVAVEDVTAQVDRLVLPGFVTNTGTSRLGDLLRYLRAAGRRLERLPGDVVRDRQRQAVVEKVQWRYEGIADRLSGVGGLPPALAEARWMIEELRVSLWAQDLGTPVPVSAERIGRLLDRL